MDYFIEFLKDNNYIKTCNISNIRSLLLVVEDRIYVG